MGYSTLKIMQDKPHEGLPSAEIEATRQSMDADDLLDEDKSKYPQFKRLRGVHHLTGPLAPSDMLFVGGREASGKSLFCQNVADDLLEQGIVTLYIGTEQDPKVLRIKHACIRCGVTPRWMLKPESHEMASTAWKQAREAVRRELRWLRDPQQANTLIFANEPYVDRRVIEKWVDQGMDAYGLQCVIVDHIDQVSHGDGTNAVAESTATIQLLHEMGRAYSMPIIIASQIKRAFDPLKRYAPPESSDFAGTSGKERMATIMLSLWRPLRTDLPREELTELLRKAKQGGSPEDRIYMPNTMGVRKVKDRLGTAPGEQCMLYVGKGGRLEDYPEATHGIRTGGSL